ncbi:MAG: hypothetical protein IPN69_17780 [Acidobacteria bacterium]|nr:hypothetical protein [Acidobacteriota bacterium]
MYSNRRADGVLLESADQARQGGGLSVEGSDPRTRPRTARSSNERRVVEYAGGNVFILLALDKYFNAFER